MNRLQWVQGWISNNMMRVLSCIGCLCIGSHSLAAITKIPDHHALRDMPKETALIGTWVYSKNGCDEIYTFDAFGNRFVVSNQERVKARYSLRPIDAEKGVFILKDTVVSDNAQADCYGSTENMVGDTVELILIIEEAPMRFNLCFDAQLTRCAGPFYKRQEGQ